MNVLLVEPYHSGSHADWVSGYSAHTQHDLTCLTLPGRFWKWRMHGGSVTLARKYQDLQIVPDLLLVTDMLDLTTFLALTRHNTHNVPVALYFHENQLSYPWSPRDRDLRHGGDVHYGFINYASALAADAIFFNSAYHLTSFFEELPRLLKHFPDYNNLDTVDLLLNKSEVLPLGLDLERLDQHRIEGDQGYLGATSAPVIVWNHRWEYDKNPQEFFAALYVLLERGIDFQLVVLGERFRQQPTEFDEACQRLGKRVLHAGYVPDYAEYARWLWIADILPVTSHHDFFGASVVEAVYCECYPLLPRRLSYPELIPTQFHSECLYDDFDDLVERLQVTLENNNRLDRTPLRAAVSRFDWKKMAAQYDERWEHMVAHA